MLVFIGKFLQSNRTAGKAFKKTARNVTGKFVAITIAVEHSLVFVSLVKLLKRSVEITADCQVKPILAFRPNTLTHT